MFRDTGVVEISNIDPTRIAAAIAARLINWRRGRVSSFPLLVSNSIEPSIAAPQINPSQAPRVPLNVIAANDIALARTQNRRGMPWQPNAIHAVSGVV
jgi:hypothetical protein